MKNPVSISEQIRRYEESISRRIAAAETVRDRIDRGGYSFSSAAGRAIMRKYARMQQKISAMQTELHALVTLSK